MRPVEAWFDDGVLKPAERLDLRQGEARQIAGSAPVRSETLGRETLAAVPAEDVELATTGLDTWADTLDAEDRR